MHLKVNLLKHALQGSDVLLIEINMVRAKEILPELFTGAPLTLLIYSEITDADMTAGLEESKGILQNILPVGNHRHCNSDEFRIQKKKKKVS